ncbi:MAG: hypothetical protein SGILL_000202 [Bacillariaceae sp.]
MSGFGGSGFGQQPPFGSPPPSGFGTNSGGGGFGGGGFGNNNNNNNQAPPFGGSPAPSSGMSFGASPNVMTTPPSSSGGFGQVQAQPQQSTMFGSSSFGGSSNNSSGFGSGSGFGQPQQQQQQQQQQPQQQQQHPQSNLRASANPFVPEGSSSNFNNPSTAATGGTMFGSSSNVVTSGSSGGGFGAAPSAAPSWGRSNNSNTPSKSTGSGFGNNPGSGFGGGFGGSGGNSSTNSSSASNNPFTASSSNSIPASSGFGFSSSRQPRGDGPNDDDEMGGGGGSRFPRQANTDSQATFPFGGRPPKASSKMSTVHEEEDRGGDGSDSAAQEAKLKAKIAEKKRQLQVKIEEKKRRLAEKQSRKKKQDDGEGDRSRTPTPTRDMSLSLAERNAQRFSQENEQSASSRHMLPADIRRGQKQASSSSSNPTRESGREDLENAVSLVGICQHMCPDEELVRRQEENDIQALEVPLPGRLHPDGWTLRDTAVKRFRRSAADYKLDVPEWIRPPDVLERTISYLEEQTMERDRQGPDSRFPQGVTPPPLDVYQFIWDRTRMIRKDFILQNYVGTGGLCDARAVRCHERIARWHAMCEHQLSHISDFVSMQSQQNIQELGQTMKTLNQFYDDALNRSAIEVPDDNGLETRPSADLSEYNEGCRSEIVQGKDPVDYDGSSLNNSPDNPMNALRLIGKDVLELPAHGTAEPEMRALYILLTIDNEGGMEVLKYAAKLFKERPAVYQSAPVQRAMEIFKSKKELNYVKFFAYLRSRATPYLFCCIMFKHVELMRKIAFRIMSRTYGVVNKESGETIYDQYPLDRLVKVLCFEDIPEAREACKFYNITVKQRKNQSGEIKDVVYWRITKFKEPKHPEKGHVLRLQPRKMIRTIESKLNGVTRLAVCRGQVSGEGAALSSPVVPTNSSALIPMAGRSEASIEETKAKAQALLLKQTMERARLEKQMKQREEQQRRAKEEDDKKEAELRRQEKEKQQAERRRQDIEKQKKLQIEKERQEQERMAEQQRQQEELVRRQREAEEARQTAAHAARKKAEAERVRLAEEQARKKRELEELRKQEEAERLELEHQRLLAEEQRRREVETERRREEEEARRREAIRLELEAQRKREAEERRKAKKWQDEIDAASKLVLWKRWRREMARPLEMSLGVQRALLEIDAYDNVVNLVSMPFREERYHSSHFKRPSARKVIEALLQRESCGLSLAAMAMQHIAPLNNIAPQLRSARQEATMSTFLFKVAVVIPETFDVADQSFSSLVYQWIDSCIRLGFVDRSSSSRRAGHASCEVRAVMVRGSSHKLCKTADMALIVVPPTWSDPSQKLAMLGHAVSSVIDDDIPRVVLVLSDETDENIETVHDKAIARALQGGMERLPMLRPASLSPVAFNAALESSLKRAAKMFVQEAYIQVSRVSTMHLAAKAITTVLWQCIPASSSHEDEDTIIQCSRMALETTIQELAKEYTETKDEMWLWPPREFASKSSVGVVESYFAPGADLPVEWPDLLSRKKLQEEYGSLLNVFRGHFSDVFQRLLLNAPTVVRDDCAAHCARGHYRQCLQASFTWLQDSSARGPFLYLPMGFLDSIMDVVVQRVASAVSIESQSKAPREPSGTHDTSEFLLTTGVRSGVSNKRRRSSPRFNEDDGTGVAEIEEVSREKRHKEDTMMSTSRLSADVKESDDFTRKLERLLQGETVDTDVGDTSRLSRLLRDVPAMDP